MVSYRRALRPVWIAAVAGAAVVAVTLVAVGAPAKPYPGGHFLTIYDPVTEKWGAVAPDLTPIGLPRALIPAAPVPALAGIRGWFLGGRPPCSFQGFRRTPSELLTEPITQFRLCTPAWGDRDHPQAPVTIGTQDPSGDFQALAQAMSKPDRFARICPAMAIIGPEVYAHTEAGWWFVQQPMQGCWPDYQLLGAILASHQPTD